MVARRAGRGASRRRPGGGESVTSWDPDGRRRRSSEKHEGASMAAQGRSSPSTDPSATDPTSPGGASRTGETPRAARGRRRRLDTVLDLVIDNGHISVEALVAQLGISPATARRDLDALADQQLVIRSHGGASANPDSSSLPLRYWAARNAGQKEAIAAAAVDLVRPGSVIGLNGGTTTTALAHELASRQDFRDCERAKIGRASCRERATLTGVVHTVKNTQQEKEKETT